MLSEKQDKQMRQNKNKNTINFKKKIKTIKMNNKIGNLIMSFALAVVVQSILLIGAGIFENQPTAYRIFVMFGGSLPEGAIQFFTYFLFFFGMLDVKRLNRTIKIENSAYNFKLLPEKEQFVLSPNDVSRIKLLAIDEQNKTHYLLLDLIIKACTKYRANKSTSEALEVVTAQVRINLSNSESDQSIIRYITWAIPSVGFIGTIIGIAASLGLANEVNTQEGIQKVTSTLNIAFDTTLVALFLSLILVLFFHILQEKNEKFHANMEGYILENLINRIYNS